MSSTGFKDSRFKDHPEVQYYKPSIQKPSRTFYSNMSPMLPVLHVTNCGTDLQTKYSQAIADHGMTIWEQTTDDNSITSDYFSGESIIEQFINAEPLPGNEIACGSEVEIFGQEFYNGLRGTTVRKDMENGQWFETRWYVNIYPNQAGLTESERQRLTAQPFEVSVKQKYLKVTRAVQFGEEGKSPGFSPSSDATTASLHGRFNSNSDSESLHDRFSSDSDSDSSTDADDSPGLQQREPSSEPMSNSQEFDFSPREISSAQSSPTSQPSPSRNKKVTWAKDTIYNDGETVPEIFMTDTPENIDILDAIPALSEVEWSAWWWGPWVAKTIFSLSNSFPIPGGNFQNVDLPDGGQLNLDWYCDSQPKENGTVLICPGINVRSRCYHIWKLANMLTDQGFNVVVINYRGVAQPLTSARLGYADSWLDFPYALRKIGERICYKNNNNNNKTTCENYEQDIVDQIYGSENMQCDKDIENMKMYAVGTSMGAMLLSRFSVEQDNREHSLLYKDTNNANIPTIPTISGQVLISGPLHMKRLVHEIFESSYMGLVWSFLFALTCKIFTFLEHWTNKHWYIILFKIGLWHFISALTTQSFSDVFAGVQGSKSGTEYWEQCSSGDDVGRHENSPNTLCIISKQDVIVPRSVAKPRDPLPQKVIYVESDGGAHIAFGIGHMGWVNEAICDYFEHLLDSSTDSETN